MTVMLNSRAIWLLLFLLSVFGSSPAHAFLGKNRVGDFFSQGRNPVRLNGPARCTGAGENPYYHYETASGNPEARYYNPLIRRFINSDPARDQWNWFAYAGGNPVSYVDPTGFAANLANNSGIGNLESLGFNAGGLERMAAESEVFAYKALTGFANAIGAPFGAELPVSEEIIANIRRGYGVDPNSLSSQIIDETTDVAMIAGSVIVSRKGTPKVTKEIKVRPNPGRDGAISTHIIERIDDQANSVTHQVTKDGKVLHQHQTHIGKYGTERRFPDEWIEYSTIPEETR